MKNIITIVFSLFFLFSFSQNDLKLDSTLRSRLIYATSTEVFSSTSFRNSSTGASARGLAVDFRVGPDGYYQTAGRRGKSLKAIFKDDPEALTELRRAYKVHLRKKRICNTLEYISYGVIVGSVIPFFIGLDDYETEGVTGLVVGGGIGVVAGFAGVLIFKKRTDKHMDDWRESVLRSISIYNNNLIKNYKK